jgi:hypothetical protein
MARALSSTFMHGIEISAMCCFMHALMRPMPGWTFGHPRDVRPESGLP